jgi:hypothetical protein
MDPQIKIGLEFDLRSAFPQPNVVFDRSLEAVPELLYFDSPYCLADQVNAMDLSDQSQILALLKQKCQSTPTSLTSADCLGTIGSLLACMCSCQIGHERLTSTSIEGLLGPTVQVLQMLPNFKQFKLALPPSCPQPCEKPTAPPLPAPSVVAQFAPCSDSDVASLTKLAEAPNDQQILDSLSPTCRGCILQAVRFRVAPANRTSGCLKPPDQIRTVTAPLLTNTAAPTGNLEFDWTSGFSGPAKRALTTNAGDSLTFTHLAGHNIVQVDSLKAFESCDFSNGIIKSPGTASVYDSSSAASYVYRTPTTPGTTEYFVCGVSSHCAMGQKLALTVMATHAPTQPPLRQVALGAVGRAEAPAVSRCAAALLGSLVLSSVLATGRWW